MSDIITYPAKSREVKVRLTVPEGASVSKVTFLPPFASIEQHLSGKALRRPNRTAPLRVVTNAELKRLAKDNPPPPEWYAGEDDRPF